MMANSNNDIAALIAEICSVVAAPWCERITAAAGCSHARGDADRFKNIRGFILHDTFQKVLAGIAGGCGRETMIAAMETFMKIQALEAPTPEAAVDFLQKLKSLVHEYNGGHDCARIEAARAVDTAIDGWIPVATELYHEYRALLPRLKDREKRRTEIRTLKKNTNREDRP